MQGGRGGFRGGAGLPGPAGGGAGLGAEAQCRAAIARQGHRPRHGGEGAVGQAAPFGTLSIQVRACNARPVGEVPDAAAWMEITDSLRPGVPAFRGWMFANAPGVEHAGAPRL